tara:strand:+ start:369 stop:503 length:135 start_codon:yes stop_codon:yes gene_type:complete
MLAVSKDFNGFINKTDLNLHKTLQHEKQLILAKNIAVQNKKQYW